MSHHEFDLIVIGTGPAASSVAKKVAKQDRRVAVIEAREFGGTCALRGCNPKKVFANAGELMARIQAGRGSLVQVEGARIDWSKLQRFKREFTNPIPEKTKGSLLDRGIEAFQGTATFTGPQTVSVADQQLMAHRIFVATGSCPRPLEFPGADLITTSDEFLELESLPEKVVFIGGGYISMEFAHVVARAGHQVTVLEQDDRILKDFDPDLVKMLEGFSGEQGIEIRTGYKVDKVEAIAVDRYRVSATQGDNQIDLECGLVVHGAGRTPNLDALSPQTGNLETTSRGIAVDQFLRSKTNFVVFAAGDCADTGKPKLTPTANEEARAVVQNIFLDPASDQHVTPDYGTIPAVVFSTPCLASIGMSEDEAKSRFGDHVEARYEDMSSWGSVRKTGLRCAGYKVLVHRETDQILGAHLLGPGAEESINLFALAMKHGLTATGIKSTLFAFPTHASDVRNMVK